MSEQLVVLKAYPEIDVYSSDMEYGNLHPDVANLLLLAFDDIETGAEPDVVEVTVTTCGQLLDVCFNNRSCGWNALSMLCKQMCDELHLPDIVARGTAEECQSYALRSDAIYYTIPLHVDANL